MTTSPDDGLGPFPDTPRGKPTSQERHRSRFPVMVSVGYAAVSAVWIAASDRIAATLFAENLATVQTYKGWLFILITATLLFLVLHRESRRRQAVEHSLRDQESRLHRERGLLEAVLRQAPVGISIAGAPDGKALILNDRAREITQIAPSGDGIARYASYGAVHPDGRAYGVDEYPTTRALRYGETIDREPMTYRRPDGRTVELEVSSVPVCDDDGRIAAAVTVIADTTDRKATKRELDESRDLLRTTTDALPALLFVTDADGKNIYTNQSFQDYTGLSPEALLGDGWLRIMHPDDRKRAAGNWAMAVESGTRYEAEYRFQRHDGVYRWHLCRGLRETRAKLWVGTCTDIHNLKEAEQAVAESEERVRRAIDDAPFPVMVHAEDGTIVHVSRSWLEATGYRRDEIATIDDWTERAYGERRTAIRMDIERLHRLDRPIDEGEYVIRTADGRERTWAFRSSPIGRDAKGRRLVVSMAADITDRKDAEDRLRLLMREVDHRAKNALAVVQSIVLLSRADDPAEFASAVEGRVTAMARAHALLAASRWSGADLATLAGEELGAFAQNGRVAISGPPVAIVPEVTQSVSMVLHELVTNAAKYGALSVPEGNVAVTWKPEPGSGRLALCWTETGGPPVATPTRHGFGTTLMEQTILDQMSGDLEMDWDPAGLRCRITLPRDCYVVSGVRPAAESPRKAANDHRSVVPGSRVLVVEDEALTAMGLQQVLEGAGYAVLGPVGRVQEAIDLARREPPDAAVLDVNLFGQSSFPVAETLDAMGVPFIFCTGYGGLDTANERLRKAPVLSKPVPPDTVLRAIGTLIGTGSRPNTGVGPT
ncbi:PAS domain S-box protein [Azospirillum sp. sgz302134]